MHQHRHETAEPVLDAQGPHFSLSSWLYLDMSPYLRTEGMATLQAGGAGGAGEVLTHDELHASEAVQGLGKRNVENKGHQAEKGSLRSLLRSPLLFYFKSVRAMTTTDQKNIALGLLGRLGDFVAWSRSYDDLVTRRRTWIGPQRRA